MKKEILGKKLGMTQMFAEDGTIVPVTVVEATPNVILQKKNVDVDGYDALKVAFIETRESLKNRPEMGEFKKAGVSAKKYVREIALDGMSEMKLGDEVKCDIFAAGDYVDVTGKTRGRGFTGVIQRWNQKHQRNSHGASLVHRAPGSMGAGTSPGRVFKGKKLAGQYGNETVTIQNLEIFKVDAERNLILIKGAIPGNKGGIVRVRSAVKKA